MDSSSSAETWLGIALDRLRSDGFTVTEGVSHSGLDFSAVAHRSRIEGIPH